jgi:hypothetical protein
MSLDLSKLENVRELAGGGVQARCPACAADGGDSKGEHLRTYPDGKFGCCKHPKDHEHNKRIFALAGVRQRREHFTLRPFATKPAATRSIRDELISGLRAVNSLSLSSNHAPQKGTELSREAVETDLRTLRTPFFTSCVRENEEGTDSTNIYKSPDKGVLSVLSPPNPPATTAPPQAPAVATGGAPPAAAASPEEHPRAMTAKVHRVRVKDLMAAVRVK